MFQDAGSYTDAMKAMAYDGISNARMVPIPIPPAPPSPRSCTMHNLLIRSLAEEDSVP